MIPSPSAWQYTTEDLLLGALKEIRSLKRELGVSDMEAELAALREDNDQLWREMDGLLEEMRGLKHSEHADCMLIAC